MESRHDTENAERILYNMTPQQLVRLGQRSYYQITELDPRALAFSCEPGIDQSIRQPEIHYSDLVKMSRIKSQVENVPN